MKTGDLTKDGFTHYSVGGAFCVYRFSQSASNSYVCVYNLSNRIGFINENKSSVFCLMDDTGKWLTANGVQLPAATIASFSLFKSTTAEIRGHELDKPGEEVSPGIEMVEVGDALSELVERINVLETVNSALEARLAALEAKVN